MPAPEIRMSRGRSVEAVIPQSVPGRAHRSLTVGSPTGQRAGGIAGRLGAVIARVWRGWAAGTENADAYQRHYETEVAEHLGRVAGFRGARLLRGEAGGEVEFTSITFFASMADVRGFAGDD